LLTDKYILIKFENKDNYFFRDLINLTIVNVEIKNPKNDNKNTINNDDSILFILAVSF